MCECVTIAQSNLRPTRLWSLDKLKNLLLDKLKNLNKPLLKSHRNYNIMPTDQSTSSKRYIMYPFVYEYHASLPYPYTFLLQSRHGNILIDKIKNTTLKNLKENHNFKGSHPQIQNFQQFQSITSSALCANIFQCYSVTLHNK